MQKILKKRVFREFKDNLLRYLALGLLIVMCMYLVVSLIGAAETVIHQVDKMAEENHLEDGEFTVFSPLTTKEEQNLMSKGITLEKEFYFDYEGIDSSTIRVYQVREFINLIALDSGSLAESENEAVLEKRYCEEHDLTIGDQITIGGLTYTISGIGSVPDYDAPYKKLSDTSVDSKQFGIAFVSQDGYENLKHTESSIQSEEYVYSYLLNDEMTDKELKEFIKDTNKLTQFLAADENPRIKASSSDQVINKYGGLIAGVIVMILFTYVISVFVVHNIESESSIIGALYALGTKKKDLLIHYVTLPVCVTLVAGIIGTALGFSKLGVDYQMLDCYDYFSVPVLNNVYPVYLLIYGVVMPPLAALIVNSIVIRKKLSRPVLSMIRNEGKSSKINKIELGKMSFIRRFRIRQMLRQSRTGMTVLFGMFISLLILMLAFDCYVMCNHISVENKEDTKYEYMYLLKYPMQELTEDGTQCYAKTLKKEIYGYNLDVTLLGITNDNPYFDANVTKGMSRVIISTAMSQKYHLKSGDQIILTDQEEDRDYAFTVEGICNYSTGLYVFMDIDSMRELLDAQTDYYNVILSDHDLKIPAENLYSVTTKADIEKSSDIFISQMKPMVYMLVSLSALIFGIVMYLMMKVMLDRCSFHISLIRIFGYNTSEIRKLYLTGNFYLVAIGAAICIPLSKLVMDKMYPLLVSNVGCGMNLTFSWQLYGGIYLGIIILYLFINQFLVRRIKKMVPAEVLKNRE